jgi:lipopolysaccharide export system protein LptA
LRFLLTLLTLTLAPELTALDTDQAQPIRISADQALRDEKKGVTVYKGHVRMDQGSLQIRADRITIYHDREEADRIIARGSPATLQQTPDPAKGPMNASAASIEYLRSEDRVLLKGEARIEQDGSTVTGETIEYFISQQRVKADSDQTRKGSRVEVVIPAQQLQQKKEDTGGTTEGK